MARTAATWPVVQGEWDLTAAGDARDHVGTRSGVQDGVYLIRRKECVKNERCCAGACCVYAQGHAAFTCVGYV